MFGVETGTSVAQLEMEDVSSVGVFSYSTKCGTRAHGLAFANRDSGESRIDGDVGTVTYHDNVGAAILEDGADGAVEHGSCGTPLLTADVYTLIVERDIAESGNGVVAIVTHHAVAACDGHRKPSLVADEVA